MRLFLKKFVFFLIYAAVGYVCILIFAGLVLPPFMRQNLFYFEKASGFTCERMKEAESPVHKDVLFLGSSRAYRGFDPRVFRESNISSFNLGSSNQTPMQTLLVLHRYLKDHRPKLVVFEVNPDIFSNDGVESAVDLISHIRPNWDVFRMALNLNHLKVYNTLIFHNILDLFLAKDECPKPMYDNEKYIQGGYVEMVSDTYKPFGKSGPYNCNPTVAQFEAFTGIIKRLKEDEIPLLLVQSPIQRQTYEKCHNNDEFSTHMRRYCRYIDFNTLVEFDQQIDFTDAQHLSQKGVIKFNSLLLQEINQLPFFGK
jgi:hypothetical protein